MSLWAALLAALVEGTAREDSVAGRLDDVDLEGTASLKNLAARVGKALGIKFDGGGGPGGGGGGG